MTDTGENSLNMMSDLRKSLQSHLRKANQKLEKQKVELEESQKHLWYKQIGDSLLAISGEQNQRGQSKLMLLNVYSQQQEPVTINPKLTIKENAELLFKKAKKGKRGADISEKKVESTEKEIRELSEMSNYCDEIIKSKNIPDSLIFDKIQTALKKYSVEQPSSEKQPHQYEKVPFRHFHIDGWDIYIGKTDAQNDELSIHFAKPSDIWLHVAGHAGSHVIIRRHKNQQMPPHEVLEKGAAMAVWFSKAKHTSFSEVHYTEARYVRKRRHAPPGEVMVDRFKSIRVSPKSPQILFPSSFLEDEQS